MTPNFLTITEPWQNRQSTSCRPEVRYRCLSPSVAACSRAARSGSCSNAGALDQWPLGRPGALASCAVSSPWAPCSDSID
ncbi:Uncharacterised protein [Mycobacteroides abscessus subsp. abscessus]|nr:Uncharacterised protein [Mycobacteroides abscessus subsp. abscessus]